MSHNNLFDKDNIDIYLDYFGKEYDKLTNGNIPLQIILVGGASILLNYNFRKQTNDIDFSNPYSEYIDNAVLNTAKKFNLFKNWLNNDFRKTSTYSDKINNISTFYKKLSNNVEIRTLNPEYIIVMKLISSRVEKHDLSDVAGILMECKEYGKPLNKNIILDAAITLYGNTDIIPKNSLEILDNLFKNNDYKNDYIYLFKREEMVRKKYKELKNNIFNINDTDHKSLLRKAAKEIDNKYDNRLLNKETILLMKENILNNFPLPSKKNIPNIKSEFQPITVTKIDTFQNSCLHDKIGSKYPIKLEDQYSPNLIQLSYKDKNGKIQYALQQINHFSDNSGYNCKIFHLQNKCENALSANILIKQFEEKEKQNNNIIKNKKKRV